MANKKGGSWGPLFVLGLLVVGALLVNYYLTHGSLPSGKDLVDGLVNWLTSLFSA